MEITTELLGKLRAAKSKDEFAEILTEHKIELSPDETEQWYQHESKIGELSEDELAEVTGGFGAMIPSKYEALDLMCDRRKNNTCSVPKTVCAGHSSFGSVILERNYYADHCHDFLNNDKIYKRPTF